MAEDVRRSAEIRRMASHKVAAELLKIERSEEVGSWDLFLRIVDRLDADVVAAGDRAVAPYKTMEYEEGADKVLAQAKNMQNKLTAVQAKKMNEFLDKFVETDSRLNADEVEDGKISLEAFKLKLWTMQIPNEVSFKELSQNITEEQARVIHAFVMERLESGV